MEARWHKPINIPPTPSSDMKKKLQKAYCHSQSNTTHLKGQSRYRYAEARQWFNNHGLHTAKERRVSPPQIITPYSSYTSYSVRPAKRPRPEPVKGPVLSLSKGAPKTVCPCSGHTPTGTKNWALPTFPTPGISLSVNKKRKVGVRRNRV